MIPLQLVALRKESVDRNIFCSMMNTNIERSLSARRAWIEMNYVSLELPFDRWSLSARRAWIEMSIFRQEQAF